MKRYKFKIFDSKGKLLKEIHIKDSYISKNTTDKEDFIYRSAFYASNKFIYAVGIYETSKDIETRKTSFRTSLEIWNWDGKPVYRAKFDRSIFKFTISEKYKTLYGISAKRDVIFEYDLSNIMERIE